MDAYIRARVNDIGEPTSDQLVAAGVRLSVNALWPGPEHLALVAAKNPLCGVELFPIRGWLRAMGRGDRDYPDPAVLSRADIRGIVEQGVAATPGLGLQICDWISPAYDGPGKPYRWTVGTWARRKAYLEEKAWWAQAARGGGRVDGQ